MVLTIGMNARRGRRSRASRRASSVRLPAGERYTPQYPSFLRAGSADSRRTTMLLGLGSKRKYRYDDAGRLTTQVESNASDVGIYTMVDGYDAVGNRTSRNTNGTPCTWSYDDDYRLTGQQKSGGYATFAYDNNSNLTLKWHQGGSPQTMQYDAADRVTTMQVGGTTSTMQWGQRGVLAKLYETGVIKATYSYADMTNDLTRSEETGTVTTAVFDGDDLRRKIVLSGVTTTFVWDGADYLQARRSSGGDSLFVVLGGEVVAEVRDGTLRDFLTDPLGSVVAHLDSSQNLIAQFEYWPYGELVGTAETTDLPFLWVGSLGYHADSTLRTYVRRRAYRQDLGSWLQLDPAWPNESPYQYANSMPVSLSDPSGLFVADITGCQPGQVLAIESALKAICRKFAAAGSTLMACLAPISCKVGGTRVHPFSGGSMEDFMDFVCNGTTSTGPLRINCISGAACPPGTKGLAPPGLGSAIQLCPLAFEKPPLFCTLLHELMHIAGLTHGNPAYACIGTAIGSC